MPAGSAGRLVALALPPGDTFVAAAERVWDAGDAVLPLDPSAPADVTARLLSTLRPHRIVDDAGEHDGEDAPPVAADVAVVIATSGSTGEPKGAELTWAALQASARATLARIGSDDDDVWLSCLPWHHIAGLQVLLRARLTGARLEVHPRFDTDAVGGGGGTVVSLVPTQLLRLLEAGTDLTRFRVILLGGAPASPDLLDRAAAAGAHVVTTYGMSETCGGCVYDGVPLDGVTVEVDQHDRIRIRGPVLMQGYRLRADLTAMSFVDGWLRTHDIGGFDVDGRLVVRGRVDDVVVTGGENVVVTAVEHALAAHPSVRDVAVVGVPDEEWGERVVAVVVPREELPALADVRAWVAERIGPAAAPRQLVVVDALPMLAAGKPDRLALRRLAQAGVARVRTRNQSAEPPSTT